jgi:hypothetical protein
MSIWEISSLPCGKERSSKLCWHSRVNGKTQAGCGRYEEEVSTIENGKIYYRNTDSMKWGWFQRENFLCR